MRHLEQDWKEVPFTKEIKILRKKEDWKGIEILSESQKTNFHSIYYAESLIKQGKPVEGFDILTNLKNEIKKETADDYFILGKISRLQNNDDEAFNFYKIAAEKGSGDAQHNLSIYYERGTGTPKDVHKAFFWMVKAAENNLIDSQFNCAVAFEEGSESCEQNFEKSFYWYSRAAENNDCESLYCVAEFHEKGLFVEKNLNEAYLIFYSLMTCDDERTRKMAKDKVNYYQEEGLTLLAHYHKTKMYIKLSESNTTLKIYSDVIIFTDNSIKK
eukprot:gene10678-3299_t